MIVSCQLTDGLAPLSLGEPAAEFVDMLQPPFDPTSDIVFDTARDWIETCHRSHKQCQVTGRTGLSLLPTRVLDVGTSDAPKLLLHIFSSGEMAERGEYACLSYCWGGDQFKTFLDTVEELKTHIPIDQLSLTVADAVEVTRRLGLRYLWVDALCIVQDSDEDKAREIARMGAIYKNSTVTIAAATARAASEGFLRRPPSTPRSAAVRVRLPNGQVGIVRLTLSHFYYAGQARLERDHPLDSRGWCLQEYLLSPRLLIFSMFNVERACQIDKEVAGDGPLGRGQTFGATFRLPPAIFGGETIRDQLTRLGRRDIRFSFPRERIRLWEQIVSDFSCRELTDLRDRLPALAGIAGELQKAWGDEYMFGMWKRLLPWTLAWEALVPEGRPRERSSLAPTWSWASLNTGVVFRDMPETPTISPTDITWETGVENDMATSSPPFPCLAVNGTLVRSTEARREPLDIWSDLGEPFDKEWSYLVVRRRTAHWPDAGSGLKRTDTTYLVLRSVGKGVYTRVGLAQHRHEQQELLEGDSPWVKLSKKPKVKVYLV